MKKTNKKGLVSGLVILTIVLFIFGLFSVLSLKMWNDTNEILQTQSNETISQGVKDKINEFTPVMKWSDKLFVMFFIVLLISYIISSISVPVEKPVFFIIFMGFLVFFTGLSMILSNTWAFIMSDANFNSLVSDFQFTNFFMVNYPVIVFFIGVIGGILFYGRKFVGVGSGGSSDGFE